MIGVATAPEISVEVMAQAALLGSVPSSCGRSLITGTSRVCITETTMPTKASTGTRAPLALAVGWSVDVCVMKKAFRLGGRMIPWHTRTAARQ